MAEMAELAQFFDPPITKYMYMQGCILNKMKGDSDLLGNVVQDFTQAQQKKFNRLFENGINEQQLEVEFKKWSGPKDSAKYVDLCFKRGKSIVEKSDLVLKKFQTLPREYYEKIDKQRKRGLDFFKMGVDISREINYNLKFEQMMDYGHLLLRGPYSSMSLPQSCVLLPNEQSQKALGWFLACLEKMKLKNFRPKQILVCEAFLAISYHKNKMNERAFGYFMKSLESKSKSLPDQILFDFLRCGMNALNQLEKKEELVQFQKIKFQFRKDLFSMNYVNDLTKLFEADWKSNGYKNVDESPYFQDVIKAIEKHINGPDANEYSKIFYLDFSMTLVKLGALTDWIPKALDQFSKTELDPEMNSYKVYHTYMKYYYMIGDYHKCIEKGGLAVKSLHKEMAEQLAEEWGCEVLDCLANTIINSYVEIGWIDEAIQVLKVFSKKFNLDLSIQLAQCLRKQGKCIEAKKAIGSGLYNIDYRNIFKGVCNKVIDDNLTADVEFEKVIKSIKSFKDVKKLLNANNKYLQVFPEDEIIFVSRILPIMKKQPNSCLPIQFVNLVSALENSLKVANYFKTNLMKKSTTHFFINCCSDPIKPLEVEISREY